MGNGYIGKISAVVTANTSDLSRKLRSGKDDVDTFANGVSASLKRLEKSGADSLGKIFTPLQNLERKFKTALQFNFRTEESVAKLRQLVSVVEQVNKPLTSATGAFGRLSSEVQSAFFPALRRAQNETVRLNIELDRSGKVSAESFARAERAVDNLTQAQKRLLQVQELASQGFTGRELQFSNARVFGALQAASQASQRAALLPAGEVEGEGIARRVQALQRLRDQIARQFARVSEIRLRPNVDASLLAGAERRLDQLVARTEEASRRLDAISAKAARGKGLNLALTGRAQDLQQAEAAYGRILASVQSLDAAQRKAFRPNLRALGRLIDSGDETKLKQVRALISAIQRDLSKQGKVSLEVGDARKRLADLRSEVQSLDAAQRRAFGANLRRLSSLVRTDDAKNLAEIRKLLRDISTDLAKQLKINLRTEEAKKKVDEIKARLRGVSETLSGRQSDPFERLAAAAEKAKRAVDRLEDSRRKSSLQARIGSIESSIAAAAAPGSGLTAAQLAAAARARARQLEGIAVTAGAQRGTATDVFGPIIGSSRQRLDALKSQILSLQSALASLPRPLQSSLIPQLRAVRDIFAKLTPTSTAAEIRAAAKAAADLEKNLKRASASAQFRGTFGQFLRDGAVERYVSQLKSVQGQLAAIGVTARGPVADAVNQYQRALERAAKSGTLGTERVRQRLDKYIERIAAAAVATGKLTEAQAKAFAANARSAFARGDVGRFGADRLQLGLQQLAFAVDDFFSVTGGFEQRIRAIGNNLTQLGFIVGGTTGLWVTLGAVIGLQSASFLYKWVRAGVSTENQLKALNDALSRQKSLVEELAQAFDSLGDSIGRRAFSAAGQQARAFGKEVDQITRKQRELRESRVTNLDEAVQRERGQQEKLRQQLENATDGGQRVAILREIEASRRRERAAAAAAVARPTASPADVRAGVLASIRENEFLVGGRLTAESRRRAEARRARAATELDAAGSSPLGLARVIDQRIAERQATATRDITIGSLFSGEATEIARAREDVANLERLLGSLQLPLQRALDDLTNAISRSSFAAATEIEAAQSDVADAIRRGVRGASDFQAALDNTARQLEEAQNQLRDAQGIEDAGQRETAVRRAEDRVRDVGLRLDAINERAREVRLGRGFGGERTTSALSAIGGERFINEEAGLRARLRAAIDAEEQARRSVEAAIARGDEAARELAIKELEAAQAASDLAAAAAEAAVAIEQAFSRLRKAAENIVSQSERIADDAQSALDNQDPNAPGAVDRQALTEERDNAERQLIRDTRRRRELQNRLDRERAEAANNPRVAAIDRRLEELRSEREDAAANARLNGVQEDPAAAEARQNEIARLEAEREEAVREQTAETRRLIDEENRLIAARRREIEAIQKQREFVAEVERRRNPQGDAIRGLDLLETPGQRAARELRQSLADINAAVDAQVEAILERTGGRPQDAQAELADLSKRAEDARRRAIEDQLRSVAPLIFSLADEVKNSILQGPSRAALGATDASTIEGQRELNRLLRGDDSNRDVDLVELQRQSNRLLETIADNTGKENQVAN